MFKKGISRELIRMFFFICIVTIVTQGIGFSRNSYKYAYSGQEGNGAREASLQFNMGADGTISGVISISPVCESNMHLAGGKLSFKACLTGGYPQAVGTFHGTSVPACGGKGHPESGTIKIGYHPQFGVFVQLFAPGGSTGTEWYFKSPQHGSPSNPFQ
ncbi:MAG TPA: hypothetical protein ENG51_06160 [Deltaproteobacteria bacterium]|nr:hypothetical protein [Deltaproteobacteria bacterium]